MTEAATTFVIIFTTLSLLSFAPFWAPSAYYAVMRRTPSGDQFTRLVIDLLRIGRDWEVDQFHAVHPCGVRLWIANGRRHLRYEQGDNRAMSLTDRYRIWSAFCAMKAREGDTAAAALAAAIVQRYSKEQSA